MHIIGKKFSFCAAHHLPHLPAEHKCHRPHGHNYIVHVELRAPVLNTDYFVLDYGDLKVIKEYIDNELDHRDLNKIFSVTTAEYMAERLFNAFRNLLDDKYGMSVGNMLTAVRVSETENTFSEYRP